MIKSFRDKDTEAVFNRSGSRKFQSIERPAKRRMDYLHLAENLNELGDITSNRLEALSGDRKGQYSIRVSDKYRICFRWLEGHAYDVELADYH